jgi:hypothetical protein
MLIRIGLLLILLFVIVSWILRKKQIKIQLSPLGKLLVVRVFQQIIRLILRRIGL